MLLSSFSRALGSVLIFASLVGAVSTIGLLPLFIIDPQNAPTAVAAVAAVVMATVVCLTPMYTIVIYKDEVETSKAVQCEAADESKQADDFAARVSHSECSRR
jgi:hypothetical protein